MTVLNISEFVEVRLHQKELIWKYDYATRIPVPVCQSYNTYMN